MENFEIFVKINKVGQFLHKLCKFSSENGKFLDARFWTIF